MTSRTVMVWLVSAWKKRPSSNWTWAGSMPKASAATRLPLAMISSVACNTDDPPTSILREPPCPPPMGVASVSAWTKWMSAISRPSWAARICDMEVSMPMPVECAPVRSVTEPSGLKLTPVCSFGPPPVHSK